MTKEQLTQISSDSFEVIEYLIRVHNLDIDPNAITLMQIGLEEMLWQKNQSYGSSATYPIRVFSRLSVEDSLFVRIDDKLSRIARGDSSFDHEDTVLDLIGYLYILSLTIQDKSKVGYTPRLDPHSLPSICIFQRKKSGAPAWLSEYIDNCFVYIKTSATGLTYGTLRTLISLLFLYKSFK